MQAGGSSRFHVDAGFALVGGRSARFSLISRVINDFGLLDFSIFAGEMSSQGRCAAIWRTALATK